MAQLGGGSSMDEFLDHVTEKDWQTTVTQTARTLGWTIYHTHDSRRSEPGFPDLVLARRDQYGEPGRLIFAELKTDKPSSNLSAAQTRWFTLLRDCGQEVYLWRPAYYDRVVLVLTAETSEAADIRWNGL